MNDVEKLLSKLKTQKAELLAKTAPLRKERDELIEKIRPDEDKVRTLGKQIQKIEQPHLADLEKQILTLETALKK